MFAVGNRLRRRFYRHLEKNSPQKAIKQKITGAILQYNLIMECEMYNQGIDDKKWSSCH